MAAQQFLKYPLIFLAGFAITYALTPVLISAAKAINLVDVPDCRRIHVTPTPNIGGLGIFVGFHLACALIFIIPWIPFSGILTPIWWQNYFIVSALLLAIGIVDDIWNIGAAIKLIGQTFVALVAFVYDIRIENLLGFHLPWWLDLVVTVLWILTLVNAFNLIDGIDGLAVGLAAISSCGIAGSLLFRHLPGDALILIGLIGACLAFLRYNYFPAKIFLGDSGSMFLGFTLATIAISTASKGTAMAAIGVPLLAVGVPIFDATLAVWRRSVRGIIGRSTNAVAHDRVMRADLDHLHHRLLKEGFTQKKAAAVLYTINGSLVIIGLLTLFYRSHALGIYLIAFVVGSYLVVRHLARIELWDSGFAILEGLHRPSNKARAVLIYPVLDCFLLAIATAISITLIHIQSNPLNWSVLKTMWFDSLPIHIGIPFLALAMTKTYSRVWSRARVSEFVILALTVLGGILTNCGLSILIYDSQIHRQLIMHCVLYAGISIPLLTGCRAFLRTVQDLMSMEEGRSPHFNRKVSNTLLYGAGHKGTLFLRQKSWLIGDGNICRIIIGFIDDDLNLRKRLVHGYKVLGTLDELDAIADAYAINEIIITAKLKDEARRKLVSMAKIKKIKVAYWRTDEVPLCTVEKSNNPEKKHAFPTIPN